MTKRKHKSGMEKISQIKYEEFKKAKKNSSKKKYICKSLHLYMFLSAEEFFSSLKLIKDQVKVFKDISIWKYQFF